MQRTTGCIISKWRVNCRKCTPVKALGGMMSKHTVSVYDLIDDYEQGKVIPKKKCGLKR